MTRNSDFKSMPLFNVTYLRNGTRQKYMEDRQELVRDLLNGIISNDLE